MTTPTITTSWVDYQGKFNRLVKNSIQDLGPKTRLRDACEYALTNGGKRFRPALVLMIADFIGKGGDVSFAALAVEYCHTASLIADDLPCMDNDDFRRDHPSLHKAFDEQTALLASYALISAAYSYIAKNGALFPKETGLCALAVECASKNCGITGASGGQYLDLSPPNLSEETLDEVLRLKTVSLFEISFVFGWAFGGGDLSKLESVKALSYHFGMAFQIADDIGDQTQDLVKGRAINVANVLGPQKALELLKEHLDKSRHYLVDLELEIPELIQMLVEIEQATQ